MDLVHDTDAEAEAEGGDGNSPQAQDLYVEREPRDVNRSAAESLGLAIQT